MKLHKVIKNLCNGIGTYAIRFDDDGVQYSVSIIDDDICFEVKTTRSNSVWTADENNYYSLDGWQLQYGKMD